MRKIMISIVVFLCFFVNCTSVLAIEQKKKINIPGRYDLRDKGKLNETKDNGSLSITWETAGAELLETSLFATEGKMYKFSWKNINTQNTRKYSEGYDRGVYSVGNMQMLGGYLASWRGPVLESEDPSRGYEKIEDYDYTIRTKAQKHVQEILFLPEIKDPKNTDYIKEKILKYGSVQAKIWNPRGSDHYNINKRAWYYNGRANVYTENEYQIETVTLIGWNDDFPKHNFKSSPKGNGAWIAKISKGLAPYYSTDPDKGGYINISYYDSSIGREMGSDVAMCVVSEIEEADNYDNIYQYDMLGYNSRIKFNNKDDKSVFANTFSIGRKESLAAVSFYTLEEDVYYKIYMTDSNLGGKDEIEKNKIAEGSFPQMGYHTVKLEEEIPLGEGAISFIVELYGQEGAPLIAMDSRDSQYDNFSKSNEGESYIFKNHEFLDLKNMKEIFNPNKDANVCLKIFTNDSYKLLPPEQTKGEVEFILDSIEKNHPIVSKEGFSKEQMQIIAKVKEEIKHPIAPWKFYLIENRLMGMLKDGQSRIRYNPMGRKLNLDLDFSEYGMVVKRDSDYLKSWDSVISIGGKTQEELLELLVKNGLALNKYDARGVANEILLDEFVMKYMDLVNDDGTVDIEYKRGGTVQNQDSMLKEKNTISSIGRIGFSKREEIGVNEEESYIIRIEKENNLAYIKLSNGFGKKELKNALTLINKDIEQWVKDISKLEIENVAMDLRNANPYGNYVYEKIGEYLKNKDINIFIITSHETKGKSLDVIKELKKSIKLETIGTGTGGNSLENGRLREGLLPYTMEVFQLWSKVNSKEEKYTIGKFIKPDIEIELSPDYMIANADQILESIRKSTRENKSVVYAKSGVLSLKSGERHLVKIAKNNYGFSVDAKMFKIYVPFDLYEVDKVMLIDSETMTSKIQAIENWRTIIGSDEVGHKYLAFFVGNKQYLAPIEVLGAKENVVDINEEFDSAVVDESESYSYNANIFGDFGTHKEYVGEGFRMVHNQNEGQFEFFFDKDAEIISKEICELTVDGKHIDFKVHGQVLSDIKRPYLRDNIIYDPDKKYILKIPKEAIRFSDGENPKKSLYVELEIEDVDLNYNVFAHSYYLDQGEMHIKFNKVLSDFNDEGFKIVDSSGDEVKWKLAKIDKDDDRTVIIYLEDTIEKGKKYSVYLPENRVKSLDGEIMSHEIDENFIVR